MPDDRAEIVARIEFRLVSENVGQVVGGARGICGPRAIGLASAELPHRDSAAGTAAPGANAAIAGASASTL